MYLVLDKSKTKNFINSTKSLLVSYEATRTAVSTRLSAPISMGRLAQQSTRIPTSTTQSSVHAAASSSLFLLISSSSLTRYSSLVLLKIKTKLSALLSYYLSSFPALTQT